MSEHKFRLRQEKIRQLAEEDVELKKKESELVRQWMIELEATEETGNV